MKERIAFALQLLMDSRQRKHVFRWIMSVQESYLLRHRQPWLVFDAIDYLQSLALAGKRVFEYGSGTSTLFWLDHGAHCVSVEHDPTWAKLILREVGGSKLLDYRFVPPGQMPEGHRTDDPEDPDSYLSSDPRLSGYSFQQYVSQIDAFPDEYFDIVLIDGRARPSCIKHSYRKVRVGGVLIVDNSDRLHYFSRTMQYLEQFARTEFFGAGPINPFMWKTDALERIR